MAANVHQFIKESKQYFVNRGWDEGNTLFYYENNTLHLFLSFFSVNNDKIKKRNPLKKNDNKPIGSTLNLKCCRYIFEHIHSLWTKHNMGDKKVISHKFGEFFTWRVNYDGCL